jgi:hypothetical protein
MILAWLLLLTGLTISAVAIYYSVIGLAAIFAAAVIPIIVMGTTLEVAKLVCASWLKANWDRIPFLMKTYMTTAVVVLMLITSMGIFGFLSKAHSDQNIISGDVQATISLADEKIKIERENIVNAQSLIKQMDAAVNGVISTGDQEVRQRDGTTRVQSAAERSLQIRRSQAKDRDALTKQIEQAQARIVKLQEDSAPIRAEMRKVEAEVGPIKYIAKLIYGDNPDTNLLEKAVTWVIMIIVVVFDPLAIIMLLAAQMTFQWRKQEKEDAPVPAHAPARVKEPTFNEIPAWEQDPPDTQAEGNSLTTESNRDIVKEATVTARFVDHGEHPKDNYGYEDTHTEVPSETPSTALGGDITAPEEKHVPLTTVSEVEQWNKMIEEAERAAQAEPETTVEDRVARGETFIDGEGKEISLDPEISKKKTYMTKDNLGHIQIKEKK